jgi:hypothetical protein
LPELLNLKPEAVILLKLAFEEPDGQGGFLCNAARRQDIGVTPLVARGCKIAELDQALFNERI